LEVRANHIPNYLKAASPIGLRRLMLLNSIKLNGFVTYFSVQYVNEGKDKYWIAWYYSEIQNDDQILKDK